MSPPTFLLVVACLVGGLVVATVGLAIGLETGEAGSTAREPALLSTSFPGPDQSSGPGIEGGPDATVDTGPSDRR